MDPTLMAAMMGGSMLGNLLNSQQSRHQAQDELALQMAMNRDQIRQSQASRTDAYGNRVYYDPITNGWKTDLDPYQDRIIKAGEHEQLLGLTDDAARNRMVRERAFERGGRAADDYDRLNSQYKYGENPSEGAVRDKLTELMALAQPKYLGPQSNIRTAGNLPTVINNSATYQDPVSRLAQTMLQARQGATSEVNNRATARNSQYLPALSQYDKTAGGGGGAPINMSNTPQELNNSEGDMSKLIATAYNNASKNIGNAGNKLTDTIMKTNPFPSYKDDATLASAFNKSSGKSTQATGSPGYYGGSPETNPNLNPSTYDYYDDNSWKQYLASQNA